MDRPGAAQVAWTPSAEQGSSEQGFSEQRFSEQGSASTVQPGTGNGPRPTWFPSRAHGQQRRGWATTCRASTAPGAVRLILTTRASACIAGRCSRGPVLTARARRPPSSRWAGTRRPSPEFGDDPFADPSLESLPPGVALLVVKRGPNAGSRFLLDSDITTAGRHRDSHIFLDDVTVSRRHAEFYRRGDRFTVRDVGSLNGTYVNQERIEEAALIGGDEVQIGKFRLVFLTGAAEAAGGAWWRRRAGRGMSAQPGRAGFWWHRAEVLAQLRGGRVPRCQRVQDPFPGVRGADPPGPVAVQLPPVRARRRGPAALHPDRAAGRVPAAASDQGPAGRGGR